MHRFLAIGLVATLALASSSAAAAWSWPADGPVLRTFALGPDAYASGQHRGIDVAGPDGSGVRAPASGVVTFAGSLPTYGHGVTILTDDGYAVTLVHLGTIGVATGDNVPEGAVVGTMGISGTPEPGGLSVHLGIRRAADEEGYVDPLGLLPPRAEPAPAPAPEPVAAPATASATAPAQQPTPPVPPASAPIGPTADPVSASAGPAPTVPAAPSAANAPAEPSPANAGPGDAASAITPPAEASVASSAPQAGIAIQPGITAVTSGNAASPAAAANAAGHTGRTDETGRLVGSRTVAPPRVAPLRVAATTPSSVRTGAGAHADAAPIHVERSSRPTSARSLTATATDIEETTRAADVTRAGGVAAAHGVPPDPPLYAAVPKLADVEGRAAPAAAPSARVAPEPRRKVEEGDGATADSRLVALPELAAGLVLASLLAATVGRRVARRIGMDGAVLRHHADLLRQLDAAHRARVHDRGRGRVRPPSEAART